MKVLWFSLSPCNSIRRNNITRVTQGWMISLENEIKKCNDIQLEIAYFTDKEELPFIFEGVKYYPMNKNLFNQKYGINRIIERHVNFKEKDKIAIKVIMKVISQSQPDLIHIHGTEEAFGLIVNQVKDIPIVFSIQGLIAPYKEKFFSGIPQQQAYKYDSLLNRIKGDGIKKMYKSFCYRAEREKMYLSHAQYIFGRTYWDKACTLALNSKRTYFIVNEILRPEFYARQWKGYFSKEKIKIVSTISGGIYKGYETVLKTAFILKKYSLINYEWHIAGYTSNSKWVNIFEKTTKIHSSECNIVFHGRVDAEELSNILCDSDIYVHVSHIENSPNSVCEAMILGMPIIASNAGGTSSLLKDEEDGLLYQDGDPYILAGYIIEMIKNPDMAYILAKKSQQRARIRHNPQNVINELVSGYKSIVKAFHENKV